MKRKIQLGLILTFAASLIPFNTTLVSEWRIQVVDQNGKPYKGQLVRQHCYNYTLGIHPCYSEDSDQFTDENGYVVFPERKITASLLSRFLRTVYNSAMVLAHGSIGTDIRVDSSGAQGYQEIQYRPGQPMPDKFILSSEPLKFPEGENFPSPFR